MVAGARLVALLAVGAYGVQDGWHEAAGAPDAGRDATGAEVAAPAQTAPGATADDFPRPELLDGSHERNGIVVDDQHRLWGVQVIPGS